MVNRLLCFALVFFLLGWYVVQLRLYLDDSYFIFPAQTHSYTAHFNTYTQYYGIFRPLTLLYYYFIYTSFLAYPSLSHLLPFFLFIITILVLYRLFQSQNLSPRASLSICLLIALTPFALEGYSWFAANSAIIAYFLFITNLWLLITKKPNFFTLIISLLLNLLATFTYESTIFMPLIFIYLFLTRSRRSSSSRLTFTKTILAILLFLAPVAGYLYLRLAFPPTIFSRIQFLSPQQLLLNILQTTKSFVALFSPSQLVNFWYQPSVNGLFSLASSPFLSILSILFIASLIYTLFFTHPSPVKPPRPLPRFFWLFTFILSLLPLTFQSNYLPFRTYLLPLTLLLLLLSSQFSRQFLLPLKPVIKLTFIPIIILLLGLNISLLSNLRDQYHLDKEIAAEINKHSLATFGPHPYQRQTIIIDNLPTNMLESATYGDSLLSAYYHPWAADYFHYFQTQTWENFGLIDNHTSQFKSNLPQSQLLLQKPILYLRYTDTTSCHYHHCLDLVSVTQ